MNKKLLAGLIALILILVLTLSVTACNFWTSMNSTSSSSSSSKNDDNNISTPDEPERDPLDYSNTFWLVDYFFNNFSIFDIDYETAMLAAIRAYVEATGDKYAVFYTPEELEALFTENNGDLYGIGVQVIFDYKEYFMEIVLIMPDSPALSYLQIGDKVTHIYIDGEKIALADVVAENIAKAKEIYPTYTEEELNNVACYDAFQYAVANLKGPEGTYAKFTVDRDGKEIEMEIQRAKVKTVSVTCKTSIKDSSIGIVSISQFDLTTPVQFKECMDKLVAQGCNKFIFDVRNNPGGDLASLVAVVSTLLEKDDVILTTKDSSGKVETTKVKTVNYSVSSGYSTCNVTNSDIGKYKGYEFVVLANENSASAAELFTANLRDHGLAQIVGTKTYGKGSVQSIVDLSAYGSEYYGGLRLTTKLYFPPCGEGYDGGIGIEPNYNVELEGKAAETHFYKLTEEIDNQLQKAVSLFID